MPKAVKKIMLITPNCTWFDKRPWNTPPYTLGLLRAVLPDEQYEIEILDANLEDLDFEQTAQRIEHFHPDLAGVLAMSLEYARNAHQVVKLIKQVSPNVITLLGGVYGTVSLFCWEKEKFVCPAF